MRVLPRVFKTKKVQGAHTAEATVYSDASSATSFGSVGGAACLSSTVTVPSASISPKKCAGASAVWPPDKENVGNSAQASCSQPIYVSSLPGKLGSVAQPPDDGRHRHQRQPIKFHGTALAPLDVRAAHVASMQVVEPLTPAKLGVFCPEIQLAPDFPDSRASTSGLCQELMQLSSILDSDAHSALQNGIKQRSMRLPFTNLTIQERIGEKGGQGGQVYSAIYRDPETCSEQYVAVKRYPSPSTMEQLAAFEREVNLMALVSSRCHHCVRYWGWCQAPDGAICLVMKRYQQSLNAKLDSLPNRKMPLEQVQRYGKQIAQALSELHAQNILFLDLKPSNILLDDFDNVAVCDFGISRKSGSDSPSGLYGTFNYMSPEAFDEESYGTLTTKSDVWSFACCIIEMVSGCMPWLGINMAAICYKVASMKEAPVIPSQLPDDVQQLLHRCFDHKSCVRPSFSDIHRVFEKDWENVKAPPPSYVLFAEAGSEKEICSKDASPGIEPEIASSDSAQAQCWQALGRESIKSTCDDIIPASQLVNQVFQNALREIKDSKTGSKASGNLSLAAPKTFATESSATKDETVKLMTFDKQMVEMPYDLAKRSLTLCWQIQLLEQEQGQDPSGPDSMIISLNDPSCTRSMIAKVITYLQAVLDTERGLKAAEDLKHVEAMLTDVNEEAIFSLLMVANYLDLPELTYLACKSLNCHVTAEDEKIVPLTSMSPQVAETPPIQPVADELSNQTGDVEVPELPPRKHRFDRENFSGFKLTRSCSSPAKLHRLAEGIIYPTDELLTEDTMKKMLPKQSSPLKQNFLPSAGLLDSITDWGKSSWRDLVQPRFAQAAVPPSPARTSPARAKRQLPVPPARTTKLEPGMLGRSSKPPRTPDKSIHCTPMGQYKVEEAIPLDVHNSHSMQAPERDKIGEGAEFQCELFPLEFRRMIHPDGDTYAGTCKGNLMHGIGVCWYANGDKYCGQWRAGMRHGIGRMKWNDGHLYEGSWRGDLVCPGLRSKIRKDKLGIRRDTEAPSPHPLAYRPPMSVHMFRAQISRMHGEDSSTAPDPLDRLFGKSARAPAPKLNRDTRGILTHVVDQTQHVAGMFSGVGQFMAAAIMIPSPDKRTTNLVPQAAAPEGEAAAHSPRLRFFRHDAVCDELVEEEFKRGAASASARASRTSKDAIYYYIF